LMADIGWIRERISKVPSPPTPTNRHEALRQCEKPSLFDAVWEEIREVSAMLKAEVISSPKAPESTTKDAESAKHGEPARPSEGELESLSPRELQILTLAGSGKSNKEIAVLVHISIKTVETHRNRINRKLDLHSIRDVVLCAVRNHLVSVEHSQRTSDRLSGSDLTQST
jgi:DNA-binding NarL/FixJ family response regulator